MIKRKYINLTYILLFAVLFFMHFPFLQADPDRNVDPATRGAYTDEGLNSVQSRNWVVTGSFSLNDNDTWIQGPVYGSIQIAVFSFFGCSLPNARLIILLSVFLILGFTILLSSNKDVSALFVLASLSEYHIFSFSHFALPYLLAFAFFILSFHLLIKAVESGCLKRTAIFSFFGAATLFLAIFTKISFLYLAVVPLITGLFAMIFYKSPGKRKIIVQTEVITIISLGLFFLGSYVFWIRPNKTFFDFVVLGHVNVLLPGSLQEITANCITNFKNLIWGTHLRYLFILFLMSVGFIFYRFKKQTFDKKHALIVMIALVWFAAEIHRFAMWYLPFRYILGFVFSMFLVVSIALIEIWRTKIYIKYVFPMVLVILFYLNLKDYRQSYNTRSYALKLANEYFSSLNLSGKAIIGPWAASFNWSSAAKILPVQYSDVPYKNIFEQHKICAVVSEHDEDDTNQAFSKLGFNLAHESDSVKQFSVGSYAINVYWLKN